MKKHIMVVDDEREAREFVATLLEENGYVPIQASNGEEAMATLKENRPDLIVLDILMPKQSGIKMYRQLKMNPAYRSIPVVICSGIAKRTFLRNQAARMDFNGQTLPEPEAYVEKPVTPQYLAKVLKRTLDKSA